MSVQLSNPFKGQFGKFTRENSVCNHIAGIDDVLNLLSKILFGWRQIQFSLYQFQSIFF